MTMLETQHRLFELPFSICEVSSLARLMLWKIRIALDRHGPAEARRLSIGTSGVSSSREMTIAHHSFLFPDELQWSF